MEECYKQRGKKRWQNHSVPENNHQFEQKNRNKTWAKNGTA